MVEIILRHGLYGLLVWTNIKVANIHWEVKSLTFPNIPTPPTQPKACFPPHRLTIVK